jgi:topoisomerase-4 subunit A
LLGEFKGDDKIVVWTAKNQYYITGYDIQQHFPDDTIRVERYRPNRVYSLCYYDGEQEYYYMKRFQLEEGDKTQFFLEEGAPMRFVAMTDRSGAKLQVEFGGQHQQRPTEMVDVDEFIGIKSHRAKGKRITTYEVASLTFIEPEEPEIEESEIEDADVEAMDAEMEDIAIDVDELMGDDIKADPNVDYSSRSEREDGAFSASQLDLF